jgi:hypothetical protein
VVGDGAVLVWQRPDGSARRLLTEAGVVEFDPAFSPDGGTLVFGRADPALGSGLGLWMRDGDGSHPRQVELPGGPSTAPTPSPAAVVALLRAPRIAPDGSALAFVDGAGTVSILDLVSGVISTAPFLAESEPMWLADSSGVLVTGLAGGPGGGLGYEPHLPVPALDPASFGLDPAQLGALRVVVLDRGSRIVLSTALGRGAARPTIDALGRVAYLKLSNSAEAGMPWFAPTADASGRQLIADPAALATSVSFTPEPDLLVVSRAGDRGVWLVRLLDGSEQQLSADGWLPRWLP